MPEEPTDAELLSTSESDPAAFVDVYRRHAEDLLRYFARRTLDPESAAEAHGRDLRRGGGHAGSAGSRPAASVGMVVGRGRRTARARDRCRMVESAGYINRRRTGQSITGDVAPRVDGPVVATDDPYGLGSDSDEYVPGPSQPTGTGSRALADLSKIVRDGSLAIVIPDGTFEDRYRQVVAIAERSGGFVLSGETRGDDSGALVLRIPADRLDEAFVAIRALGEPVAST